MKGKVALVTGSSRGIGLAISKRLSEAGATVVLNSRNSDRLTGAIQDLRAGGIDADGEVFDACDEPAVKEALRRVCERHGRLDVLINNAGVLLNKTVFDTSVEEWEHVLRNNLTSAFVCSKAGLEIFRKLGNGGRIVMIGSTAGQRGAPSGVVAYSASKAGLTGLAQTLAYTGADFNVTVNVVAPGMIATEMLKQGFGDKLQTSAANVPLGLGQPLDVAESVLFLVSDAGRYITGATLDVNGGLNIR